MRMRILPFIIVILIPFLGLRAGAQGTVLWESDGTIGVPTNMWTANASQIAAAIGLSGYAQRSVYDADADNLIDNAEAVPWSGVSSKPSTFPPDSHTHSRSAITDFAHASTHVSGGSDALSGNLDAVARLLLKRSGVSIGARRALNIAPGSGVTLDVTDDPGNEEVDVTITLSLPSTLSVSNLNALNLIVSNLIGGQLIGPGINATNITGGTLAEARHASTMATDAEVAAVAAGLQPLATPLSTLSTAGEAGARKFMRDGAPVALLELAPSGATNAVLDFAWAVATYAVTNNVFFMQSTNRPASLTNAAFTTVRLVGDTVDRTLGWPASWKRLGTNIMSIKANKVVLLSAMAVGPDEAGVLIGVATEE